MQEKEDLKTLLADLQMPLFLLTSGTAGKLDADLCTDASEGYNNAVAICRKNKLSFQKIYHTVTEDLDPVLRFLDAIEQICLKEGEYLMRHYETAHSLLRQIDKLETDRKSGFARTRRKGERISKIVEDKLWHPLEDNIHHALVRVREQLGVIQENIYLNDFENRDILSPLFDRIAKMEDAVSAFLHQKNASKALDAKERLIANLSDRMLPFRQHELLGVLSPYCNTLENQKNLKTIAQDLAEIRETLIAHTTIEVRKNMLRDQFDYSAILGELREPDKAARLRHDVLTIAAQMDEIVEWHPVARTLEKTAANPTFSPRVMAPAVQLALSSLEEMKDPSATDKAKSLLPKLQDIQRRLQDEIQKKR